MKEAILRAAMATDIPEGIAGLWHIKRLRTAEPMTLPGKRGVLPPGVYTQLYRYTTATLHKIGELVMHDFPDELTTHLEFMLKARGRVLITGLGLGCVARGCLANPNVESITVIERDADVIGLVHPHMPKERYTLIHADAIEWCKRRETMGDEGLPFDCAWHDLWSDPDANEPHLQLNHADFIFAPEVRSLFAGAGITHVSQLSFGCIVATCRMVACQSTDDLTLQGRVSEQELAFGNYDSNRFGWILEDIVRLPKPVPARGSQGFWEWTP